MMQLSVIVNSILLDVSDMSLFERLTEDILVKLAIALCIAVIVVVAMIFMSRSHMSVDGRTYAGNSARILRRQDRFIRTTVTTRKIEKPEDKKD